MCLSVPAKVISIDGQTAEVEVYGQRRNVLLTADRVETGDWVLIYGPIAMARLDPEQAAETLVLLSAMNLR